MPTWNRDVSVGAESVLNVSMPGSGANPSDHPNDTADTINIDGDDRKNGAVVKYHAQQPPVSGVSLHLTGITACPPTTKEDLDHLTVHERGKDIHVHVGKSVPVETYSYHVVGYVKTGTGTTDVGTTDPQIHNET